jgi:hypothetical protein
LLTFNSSVKYSDLSKPSIEEITIEKHVFTEISLYVGTALHYEFDYEIYGDMSKFKNILIDKIEGNEININKSAMIQEEEISKNFKIKQMTMLIIDSMVIGKRIVNHLFIWITALIGAIFQVITGLF